MGSWKSVIVGRIEDFEKVTLGSWKPVCVNGHEDFDKVTLGLINKVQFVLTAINTLRR